MCAVQEQAGERLEEQESNPGVGRVEFRAGRVPVGGVWPLWTPQTVQRQGAEQNPASPWSAAPGQRGSAIRPSISRVSEEYSLIHTVPRLQ